MAAGCRGFCWQGSTVRRIKWSRYEPQGLKPTFYLGLSAQLNRLREKWFATSFRAKRGTLICENPRKERFLTPQTPFGMIKKEFFRKL